MTSPIWKFLAFLAVVGLQAHAQSISVGNGKIVYQILFSQWANPAGKMWTGSACHVIGKTCDTRFMGYVDIISDNLSRTATEYTWPGPNAKIKNWPIIGSSSYKSNGLKDFNYLNLTGVEANKFKAAILRVRVVDTGYLYDNDINNYIGRLPGVKDIGVTRYESDAVFGDPIELEAVSTVLPQAVKKGEKADKTTVQQQHLFVKVRAWGENISKGSKGDSADTGFVRRKVRVNKNDYIRRSNKDIVDSIMHLTMDNV